MPELMFVLKSMAIALVITLALQLRVGSTTVESHANQWIHTSSVPLYLQEVSSGAVLAIRNVAHASGDFIGKNFGHDSSTQNAGRLSFEFKRSPQYQKEHPDSQQ